MRSTAEVFEDHLALRAAKDLERDLARNYSTDVTLLTLDGIFQGHDGVRECAAILKRHVGDADYPYVVRRIDGEVAFLHWTARSPKGDVQHGVDTFVIRSGKIIAATIYFHVERSPLHGG